MEWCRYIFFSIPLSGSALVKMRSSRKRAAASKDEYAYVRVLTTYGMTKSRWLFGYRPFGISILPYLCRITFNIIHWLHSIHWQSTASMMYILFILILFLDVAYFKTYVQYDHRMLKSIRGTIAHLYLCPFNLQKDGIITAVEKSRQSAFWFLRKRNELSREIKR